MSKKEFDGDNHETSFWRLNTNPLPGSVRKIVIPVAESDNKHELKSEPVQTATESSSSNTMPLTPQKPNKKTGSSNGNSSFQRYEESTSDAWDYDDDDDLIRGLRLDSKMIQSAAMQVINNHNAVSQLPAKKDDTKKELAKKTLSEAYVQSEKIKNGTGGVQRSVSASQMKRDETRQLKFEGLIKDTNIKLVPLDELRTLSWSGVPAAIRPMVWKLLCGYLPASMDRQVSSLERKRKEYFGFLAQYFGTRHEEQFQEIFRQIHIDVPRMNPLIPLFQNKTVQELFERILYIWAIRHPASGYVQGINDLLTPFFVVFLSDFVNTDDEFQRIDISGLTKEQLDMIEADCYWCMSKLLDGIQDNYTFAQPGIQKKVVALKELTLRIDTNLHNHINNHGIEFLQFTFRWMNNLLMRELPLRCTIRLWDTYLAESEGFANFHLYVCAAFLTRFSKQLQQETDFQGLMTKLQNLPTQNWYDPEIEELTAEAYRLKYMFADAPQHYKTKS